jgi:hypothetical protein
MSVNEKSQWTQIWDLPCLPKIKQFVWRLAHNSLPLQTNIERRGIECDILCVCCKHLDEDGAHLFLKCKEMKRLWNSIGMEDLHHRMSTHETAQAVVQEILLLNDEKKVLIFCMLWRWWMQRNKKNIEGMITSVDEILRQARYWTNESLQVCSKRMQQSTPGPIQRWQKPAEQVLKGVIGCSHHFFGSLRTRTLGELCRTMRCKKSTWAFCLVAHSKFSCISGATLAQLFGCLQTHL